jgi:hypothetical protein
LALEGMGVGDTLELRLDSGEPLESLPASALEDGHSVTVEGTTVTIVKA